MRVFCWEHALPAMLALKQMASGPLSDGCLRLLIDGQEMSLWVEKGSISFSMGHAADSGADSSGTDCCHQDDSHSCAILSSMDLQEKIFSTGSFLHPRPVGGEPKDWFPIPFSLPMPDHF